MLRKADNPFTGDTLRQRFAEMWCRTFGHVRYGAHYGMPQATCARCGRRNDHLAADHVPIWRLPDYAGRAALAASGEE